MVLQVTHIFYTLSLNSPVTISYCDGRKKNTKANLDSKMDEVEVEHSRAVPVTVSHPPQQLQRAYLTKESEEIPRSR